MLLNIGGQRYEVELTASITPANQHPAAVLSINRGVSLMPTPDAPESHAPLPEDPED